MARKHRYYLRGTSTELPIICVIFSSNFFKAWISATQIENGVILVRLTPLQAVCCVAVNTCSSFQHTEDHGTTLGLFENKVIPAEIGRRRLDTFVNLLSSGGGVVDVKENMQTERWKKVVWLVLHYYRWFPADYLFSFETGTVLGMPSLRSRISIRTPISPPAHPRPLLHAPSCGRL